jgi:hypothetical protein
MATTAAPGSERTRVLVSSGFDQLGFVLGVASVAVWTYVFNEWWDEPWGLLFAIAAAIPVGVVFSILPSILLGTLRRLPLANDVLLTWLFILGGIALGVYAVIALDGATLAMVVLWAAEIMVSGIGLLRT